MRRMSFSMTTKQFLDGTKDVTRRMGWPYLRVGDHLLGIKKGMGLKKGQHQRVLGEIVVMSARWERLDGITNEECQREGFPHMTPGEFVEMFCRANRCNPDHTIRRIEFVHVASRPTPATKARLRLKSRRPRFSRSHTCL